jgi:hypothetical protein
MEQDNSQDSGMPDALDFVDYLATCYSIDEQEINTLLSLPEFCAVVIAYRNSLIPLGYATFYSWTVAAVALPDLSSEKLLDIIRYAAWRTRLHSSDSRHITIDYSRMRDMFPPLFVNEDHTQRSRSYDRFIQEMGEFIASHPRRDFGPASDIYEEQEYAEYWLKASAERVQALLSDRRFLAVLDAFHDGSLSYGGLLERLYGDIDYVLFPEIGRQLSGIALVQMAKAIDRGDIVIPKELREEHPELFKPYNPEAFGQSRS